MQGQEDGIDNHFSLFFEVCVPASIIELCQELFSKIQECLCFLASFWLWGTSCRVAVSGINFMVGDWPLTMILVINDKSQRTFILMCGCSTYTTLQFYRVQSQWL
jgi:hypothetical protein